MNVMLKHNKLISAFLIVALLLGICPTAFAADSSITYTNGAEKFVFVPSNDLFDNFKHVMPGDEKTQIITVKNSSKHTVNIYFRAVVNENATMQGFLQQLSMTVKQGDKVLFTASPDQLAGLAENVLLGKFASGEKTELLVTLEVPIELGNEYAKRIGKVNWVFTVEEVPAGGGSGGGGGGIIKPTEPQENPKVPGILNGKDHFAYVFGYPDTTVQPNGNITRAEVAAIFYRLLDDDVRAQYLTNTNSFNDTPADAWYITDVSTLAAMNIIAGYPDGGFHPNAPITRAEFTAMASRFDKLTTPSEKVFMDITGHWAEQAILLAVERGWIGGYEDGTIRPDNNITRAEAMAITNRVLCRQPETVNDLLDGMIEWPDNADQTAWYYIDVQEATNSHDYAWKDATKEHERWTRLDNGEEKQSFLIRLVHLFRDGKA